ncbi:hypothetical protein BGZ95_002556 [Linnemannia exigua]|uniref:Uncharacterized protein n=1 Tax=Linnemannia exigua TaxID=604196 RepID=A0AAD4D5C0_9FUNG|nr:hypothetical protein BGZ95_002556 [Linnemannia exigua]
MKYNPLKNQHLRTTVVFSAFLAAFGFLQFYLYTDNESEKMHLPRFSAVEASFESRRPLTIPITIVTAASGNHACALEAFLYHIRRTMDLLQTDPEEDRRRAEERARLGREYLEMSPDLADIRKKKKTTLGNNSPPGARKAKVASSGDEDGKSGGDSYGDGGGEGVDQDVVEEKRAEAEHSRIRRNSRQHRRQMDASGSKARENVEEEGNANTPLDVGSDQSIVDMQHSTTTPIEESSSIPDYESNTSKEGGSAEIEFEIRPRLVVYNMGMGPTKRRKRSFQALIEAGYIDEPLDFDFQKYPEFWRLGTETRGEYGWKAGIIEEVAQRVLSSPPLPSTELPPADLRQQQPGSGPLSSTGTANSTTAAASASARHQQGIVLWLDSGDRISLPFLRWLPSFLLRNGMWSPQSQDDMLTWTHPGLLNYYHDSLDNYSPGETNCNGAAMAFDVRNRTVRDGIMREWVQCARTKDCIAPEGSSRSNHRQDQAALTYLVKRMGYGQELCHGMPDVFDVQVNQDRYCKEEIAAQPNRVVYT